jgi:hypothetical protein
MKHFILIILFIFLSQAILLGNRSVTCSANLKVKYPEILMVDYSGDINLTMFPGTQSERLKFKWFFKGQNGMSYKVTGDWTKDLGEYFYIDMEDLKLSDSRFDWGNGLSQPVSFLFRLNCKPGTPSGTYTGIYTVTIEYN